MTSTFWYCRACRGRVVEPEPGFFQAQVMRRGRWINVGLCVPDRHYTYTQVCRQRDFRMADDHACPPEKLS